MSRGISNIKLLENVGISITYTDDDTIENISTTGQTLDFDSCYAPEYESEIKDGANKKAIYSRELRLQLRKESQFDNMAAILDSVYGWLAIVTSERNEYAIIDPFKARESSENWPQGVNYGIVLNHFVDSLTEDFEFNIGGIGFWIIEDTFIVQ
jgi:hypothetical protein